MKYTYQDILEQDIVIVSFQFLSNINWYVNYPYFEKEDYHIKRLTNSMLVNYFTKRYTDVVDTFNILDVENKGSLTNINLSDPITLKILRDNLDTPTTVAIKGKTAWVLQAQFGHLFGDEKDIPPGPFEIVGIKYKPSILTSLKKLLGFLN